jgi:hypothetical protein
MWLDCVEVDRDTKGNDCIPLCHADTAVELARGEAYNVRPCTIMQTDG